MYWKTRDGQEIDYSELTERHIQNIINMFARNAKKQYTIPEVWDAFHDIMDEAEKRKIDVGYTRHLPKYAFSTAFATFPKFSIDLSPIGLSSQEPIYSIISSNQIGVSSSIAVLKEFVEGDISEFTEDEKYVYFPHVYKDAIDACLRRWNFTCEAMEDAFPRGLGHAWGLG